MRALIPEIGSKSSRSCALSPGFYVRDLPSWRSSQDTSLHRLRYRGAYRCAYSLITGRRDYRTEKEELIPHDGRETTREGGRRQETTGRDCDCCHRKRTTTALRKESCDHYNCHSVFLHCVAVTVRVVALTFRCLVLPTDMVTT